MSPFCASIGPESSFVNSAFGTETLAMRKSGRALRRSVLIRYLNVSIPSSRWRTAGPNELSMVGRCRICLDRPS